ncbi:hypothetical protein [Lihuaxuella thermophila]|uniref:Uncharacterized protein n=1 Tax=Lihuaxuella thermophila TaxID=1173111 RepID=A0A1H8ATE2_9BACL|nr:hypothetical protein [Lihuaxuella thermophila]SEM73975.1 hypothetical protein SAMN05444955_101341 [Lihuaxuella thermophila]
MNHHSRRKIRFIVVENGETKSREEVEKAFSAKEKVVHLLIETALKD